jgi:hypothetical protein
LRERHDKEEIGHLFGIPPEGIPEPGEASELPRKENKRWPWSGQIRDGKR